MKKIILALQIALLTSGAAFASFPIKKSDKAEKQIVKEEQSNTITDDSKVYAKPVDQVEKAVVKEIAKPTSPALEDMVILLLLWFFLGFVAAHRWYAGKPAGWNILFILTAGGCGIWAIIDVIKIIQGDFMR